MTCLGGRNIILRLKAKAELASNPIEAGMSRASILKDWITHEAATSMCMLLVIATLFRLMSLLTRTKANTEEDSSLKV